VLAVSGILASPPLSFGSPAATFAFHFRLRGANGEDKKVHSLRSFSSSLYPYVVLAVLFDDGEQMVCMGCLCKTLGGWKKIEIRKSNEREFPDDGSEKCEDRVGLFNLARAAVTRMKLEKK
jgi:hypothetical protein